MMSLLRQKAPQARWLPMHFPSQAIDLSMHAPPQTYWFVFVQTGMQLTPSQLTVPPVGAVQAWPHEVAPQLLRSLVLTHLPPHR